MTGTNKVDQFIDRIDQLGMENETREQMTQTEQSMRSKRNVALNEFRSSKLLGSLNAEFEHVADLCNTNDKKYDNTHSIYEDYLDRLKIAEKEGKPLKEVKEPTLALSDTGAGHFIKKTLKKGSYVVGKILTWQSPILMVTDIAGGLWDRKEFKEVRKYTEATESQRERIMNILESEIRTVKRHVQSRDESASDKKKEAEGRQKDEVLAQKIREELGLPHDADNENSGKAA